jgi:hypothetical protein
MNDTIRSRDEAMAWRKANEPNAPKAGDLAPDLLLSDASGKNAVQLSQFRGKRPVALVFGSFT